MNRERFHSTWPVFNFSVVFPHPSRLRRATFPVGEGFLRRGTPYLPLGEGAAAAAEEGRYRVGSASRPTPVPGFARSTFS